MPSKYFYYCLVVLFFWTGCSGTEFPNPGSDKDDEKIMLAEGAEVNESSDSSTTVASIENRQRFYQYIFNECVQVMQPDFTSIDPEGTTLEFNQVQQIDADILMSPLSPEDQFLIPESFMVVQNQQEDSTVSLAVSEDDMLVVEFKWQDGDWVGKSPSQDLTASEIASEASTFTIENCQLESHTEESLVIDEKEILVQHQQWSYQTSDLPSDVQTIIDIYTDNQRIGIQKTLRFEVSFISVGDLTQEQSEKYIFQ